MNYEKNMKRRVNGVLSNVDTSAILLEALNSHDSVDKIKAKVGVYASKSIV